MWNTRGNETIGEKKFDIDLETCVTKNVTMELKINA